MTPAVAVVVLLAFAFAMERLLRRASWSVANLSGIEYLAAGVFLGEGATGFIGPEVAVRLDAFAAVVLGLYGFLLGLSLAGDKARRGASEGFVAAAIGAAVVAVGLLKLGTFAGIVATDDEALWLALGVAAVSMAGSEAVCLDGLRTVGARGPVALRLAGMARASGIAAVALLGIVLAAARWHQPAGDEELRLWVWVLVSGAAGALSGLLFRGFLGPDAPEDRTFLATVAIVIFATGLATAMGISPLFVNVVAGLTVALVSPHASQLRRVLSRLEHPVEILVLLLAGLAWRQPELWGWMVVPAFLVLRVVGLSAGVGLLERLRPSGPPVPRLGWAMAGQGPLAAALALDLSGTRPGLGAVALTAAAASLLLTDLTSRRAIRRVLSDAGEVVHGLPLAPTVEPAP